MVSLSLDSGQRATWGPVIPLSLEWGFFDFK